MNSNSFDFFNSFGSKPVQSKVSQTLNFEEMFSETPISNLDTKANQQIQKNEEQKLYDNLIDF